MPGWLGSSPAQRQRALCRWLVYRWPYTTIRVPWPWNNNATHSIRLSAGNRLLRDDHLTAKTPRTPRSATFINFWLSLAHRRPPLADLCTKNTKGCYFKALPRQRRVLTVRAASSLTLPSRIQSMGTFSWRPLCLDGSTAIFGFNRRYQRDLRWCAKDAKSSLWLTRQLTRHRLHRPPGERVARPKVWCSASAGRAVTDHTRATDPWGAKRKVSTMRCHVTPMAYG